MTQTAQSNRMFRVLAIDDDPSNLELISEALGSPDIKVITADGGNAGVAQFKEVRPDMTLVDLMMPDISGIEVLQQIIDEDPGAEVVLMSAHYSTESAVEAIQKGASDYLNKPLDLERLRNKVESLKEEANVRKRALRLDNEAKIGRASW